MRRRIVPAPQRSLSEFRFRERMCFLIGWAPDESRYYDARWRTWEEFVADYSAVRDEILRTRRAPGSCFGERALSYRTRHGAAALARASYMDIRHDESEGTGDAA